MNKETVIRVFCNSNDFLGNFPDNLRDIATVHSDILDTQIIVQWAFNDFNEVLIPALRKRLTQLADIKIMESWATDHSVTDIQNCSLLKCFCGVWEQVELLSSKPFIREQCPKCRKPIKHLSQEITSEPIRLRFPDDESRPDFFYFRRADLHFMHKKVYERLEAAGLHTGLTRVPVAVEDYPDLTYFGVYSNCNLGWPAAPYGSESGEEPCSQCGYVTPKYAYYPTYHRPKPFAHWMTSKPSSSFLVISNEVFQWLHDDGSYLLNGVPPENLGWPDESHLFSFRPAGFYPDELDSAFLNPNYHDEADK